ncbi:hypothetical protein [uncultured Roseobacter sp.]|uniref:anti-sigma factor family protein n=1 Tax=uncultured Roseobacter sp. TaxID=114847 RepID=UPI00262202D6|nr:hypothetical protein [uncultured Roseobacter sp.]
MQSPEFSDEELMAYADGELTEERASEMDVALSNDRKLADRLALFIDTRALARGALESDLETPVPEHLVQRVHDLAAQQRDGSSADDDVIPFPQKPRTSQQMPVWKLPLAAGLALAVGLGAGLTLAPVVGTGVNSIEIAALADDRIASALDTTLSGDEVTLQNGSRIALIATFFDAENTLCREFEFDRPEGGTVVSVACQKGGQWNVRMAVAAAATDAGYAPASSLEVLDAYLTASEAGPPLEPDAEAAALDALR